MKKRKLLESDFLFFALDSSWFVDGGIRVSRGFPDGTGVESNSFVLPVDFPV